MLSSKELSEYRGDGYGRPVEYPCCNHAPSFYNTRPYNRAVLGRRLQVFLYLQGIRQSTEFKT